MNQKAKGARAERRVMKMLEAEGYVCTRAGASLGLFDVIAVGPSAVRLIQVKAGTARLSAQDRERISKLVVPCSVVKELWRLPDRCPEPMIERL